MPPGGIYSHISGIDLVKGKDGNWYVLEDNLRIPSGASYPLIARRLCRRCSPDTFRHNAVADNRQYGELLRRTLDSVNTGGINVVFTPGRYNAAYFEHAFLAEQSGAVLAEAGGLRRRVRQQAEPGGAGQDAGYHPGPAPAVHRPGGHRL